MSLLKVLIGTITLMVASAANAEGALHIELNRLENIAKGCRVNFVLQNTLDHPYSSLKLDLVIFDKDGVIAKQLAVETAPLKRRKTTVKRFDIAGIECPAISRILLNDVLTCTNGKKTADCLAPVKLSSRAGIEFIK